MPIHLAEQALGRLDTEHDELCVATGAHVTARSTWVRAVLGSSDAIPVYVEVRDGGRRVAGMPLAWRRGRLLNRVEAPGPGVTDSHWFPALDDHAGRRLAAEIAAFLAGLGRWQLQVDSAPPADPCLAELCRLLPVHRLSRGDGMPRLVIGEARALESYLSKSTRYNGRRGARNVADAGAQLRVWETRDASTIEAWLPVLLEVHRSRDRQLGRASDVDDPRYAALYRELVLRHAERGEVQLLCVQIDDKLGAYDLSFIDGSALRMWDGRLNPEFAELGAGSIASVALVQSALDDPQIAELDFMRGEEPYKAAYTNDVVATVDLWAWSGLATRVPRLGYERLRDLKRRSPALTRQWQRLRSLARP